VKDDRINNKKIGLIEVNQGRIITSLNLLNKIHTINFLEQL